MQTPIKEVRRYKKNCIEIRSILTELQRFNFVFFLPESETQLIQIRNTRYNGSACVTSHRGR